MKVESQRAARFAVLIDADNTSPQIAEGLFDILFANEVEICALAETDDFDAAVASVAAQVPLLVVTRGAQGAIALQNGVPQGLSSCIFTLNMREAETFLSAAGSDCGIANVNIGTSGAEIGGAFGGEKETGGGRESGSDAWKAYMRRATNTVNYGRSLPLAQGVVFDI